VGSRLNQDHERRVLEVHAPGFYFRSRDAGLALRVFSSKLTAK
jgi:hypothetical protein